MGPALLTEARAKDGPRPVPQMTIYAAPRRKIDLSPPEASARETCVLSPSTEPANGRCLA